MFTLPLLGACLATLAHPQEEPTAPALELRDHASLSAQLKSIATAHADVAELLHLGESRGGRAIEGLRLHGKGAEGDEARPAILLVANLEGTRVYSSAVALQHAQALAEGYGNDERVTALLDAATVLVVPRANPDAAEARFSTPRFEARASGVGLDNDRDGRQGEDPPADVNGDGLITWIRIADPDGEWMPDPTDARALVKADRVKGERGVYKLWPEGFDSDGDELVAEDGLHDARVDRNFPAGWEAHAGDSGAFPTDEPEVRALCEFVLGQAALSLVVVYDSQDSLVGEVKSVKDNAPSVKRIPPEGVLESDAKLLGELGKRYGKITENKFEGDGEDTGTFSRWSYEHRGLLTLSAALWDISLEEPEKKEPEGDEKAEPDGGSEAPEVEEPTESTEPKEPEGAAADDEAAAPKGKKKGKKGKKDDEPKPSDDAKRLRWIDAAGEAEAWRFVSWSAVDHPQLGSVEVGGLAPYARLEPTAAESGAIAESHFEWFLGLGELLPRVRIAECTREKLGEGLQRVTAVIQNDAYLPLLSRSGRRTETTRPAKVGLVLPEAGKRLGGKVQELLGDLPGSGGRKEYSWLVQGPDGMEIAVTIETTHAGSDQKIAEEKK